MKETSEKWYTIGDVARLLDISPNTLRLYENSGLVIPHRTPTNRRLYDEKDLAWLKKIRNLIKHEKMNIEGIRRLLALLPCWEIIKCKERENCPVYIERTRLCFEVKHPQDHKDCRQCEVYRQFIFCDNLKNFFRIFKY